MRGVWSVVSESLFHATVNRRNWEASGADIVRRFVTE
jgi:hypothetical protein